MAAARQARAAMREQAAAAALLREQAAAAAVGQGQLAQKSQEVATAAARSEVSMGRFKNAIANLGLASVGIQGPLGKIIETIAILGVGSVVVTGVLAGLAAVGTALNVMGKGARDAQKAYDDLLASLQKTSSLAAIGAQLDVIAKKLENMQGGGVNFATRVVRSTLADSFLGQLFGVQSEEDLRNELERLTAQYKQFFEAIQLGAKQDADAMLFQLGVSNSPATRGFGDTATAIYGLRLAFERLKPIIQWYLQPPDSRSVFKDLTRTGAGAEIEKNLIDAANRGGASWAMLGAGGEPGASPLRQSREDSQQIAESWADASRSAIQVVQALGAANDSTLLMLHNLVSVADQLKGIAETLKAGQDLSAGQLLGGAAALAGLFSSVLGMLGESAAARQAREIQQQNTEAIRKLTERIGDFGLGLTGNQFTGVGRGVADLMGRDNLSQGGNPFRAIDTNLVDTLLHGQGSSLSDLQAVADALGITLDTSNTDRFIDSLERLDEAMKQTELTRFAETFAGRMQSLNAQWQVFNTTDPIQKLTEQLAEAGRAGTGSSALDLAGRGQNLIQWRNGVPTVIPGQALDLQTAAGRNALLGNLQTLFLQLQNGTLTADQLGGLTAQEFLDQLTSMIDLIRQAEEAAKANIEEWQNTIDLLHRFRESLLLDPSLSPLTPIQRLDEARRQYDELLAKARGGDQIAASQLPDAARALLEFSRAVNASGPGYQSDFQRVMKDTAEIEALFQEMKDTATLQLEAGQSTANNTLALVERSDAQIAVLQEGFVSLADESKAMKAAIEELIAQTKLGFEGGKF